jgi:plasmid stabilization system protein ParE
MIFVRILPEVAADVAEAAKWYDRNGYVGLGDRFESAFYSSVQRLRETGEAHRTVYADFRRIFLRPFPYALYYRYHGGLLVVALVIHAARDPERVRRLLRGRRP